MIEFIDQRGQLRPTDWPANGQPQTNWQAPSDVEFACLEKSWVKVGTTSDLIQMSAHLFSTETASLLFSTMLTV
eukprot:6562820-Ditylum_brightwellii.AAC.1